ncbi:MAG: dihydroorotate dehydrogenase [Chloroflexi bacterium]|nr:dihydroorotate dehydrogenase [Chloroflexota bacterium]
MLPDLNCDIAGIRLHNPLVLASGILGTHATLLERCARSGAGAVTAKSCGPEFRQGHPNPTVIDWGPGLLNAVGLPNPGAATEVSILLDTRARLQPLETPLIASIFADTVSNFGRVAQVVCQAQPDLLEVNISCPNVGNEFGLPFAGSMDSAAAVTAEVKRVATCPVIIKLAPNVPDIAQIAQAVVAAGADAICAVNTMPGMAIDIYTGRPILANQVGGISGPALKAIAVRAIFEITAAVKVPVIGTGGVNSGLDAAELLMAGATAVGVGTAVYYRGVEVFRQIHSELVDFMRNQGYASLDQIRGIAHV